MHGQAWARGEWGVSPVLLLLIKPRVQVQDGIQLQGSFILLYWKALYGLAATSFRAA